MTDTRSVHRSAVISRAAALAGASGDAAGPSFVTYSAVAIALLFWAAAFPGIRAALTGLGPGQVALVRFLTASVVLMVAAVRMRMPLPRVRDLPLIAAAGLVGITLYHVALNFGERTVPSAVAALLVSLSPVFTALLSAAVLGERLSLRQLSGIALSIAGVAVIASARADRLALGPNALLVLAAALAVSVYMTISKRPLARYSSLAFTAYAVWAGTVPLLVFAPGLIAQIPWAGPRAIGAAVFLGVFPGAVSYVLWSYALARMPASTLSSFLNLQPVNAALIAWLWLGEVPSLRIVIGGLVALAGVILVQVRNAQP